MRFEYPYTYWYQQGRAAGLRTLAVIGTANMHAFRNWVDDDKRIEMWLDDPEEAGRAFLALRYERWR